MGLSAADIFSSTVIIFWAVAFIPWFLREKRYGFFAASWMLLFVVRLSLAWDPADILITVVLNFGILCLSTLGGIVMYLVETRNRRANDENTNEGRD